MWDLLYSVNIFFLPLVNKETTLTNNKAEYSKAGNPNRGRGKKVESGRCHVAVQEARGSKV